MAIVAGPAKSGIANGTRKGSPLGFLSVMVAVGKIRRMAIIKRIMPPATLSALSDTCRPRRIGWPANKNTKRIARANSASRMMIYSCLFGFTCFRVLMNTGILPRGFIIKNRVNAAVYKFIRVSIVQIFKTTTMFLIVVS